MTRLNERHNRVPTVPPIASRAVMSSCLRSSRCALLPLLFFPVEAACPVRARAYLTGRPRADVRQVETDVPVKDGGDRPPRREKARAVREHGATGGNPDAAGLRLDGAFRDPHNLEARIPWLTNCQQRKGIAPVSGALVSAPRKDYPWLIYAFSRDSSQITWYSFGNTLLQELWKLGSSLVFLRGMTAPPSFKVPFGVRLFRENYSADVMREAPSRSVTSRFRNTGGEGRERYSMGGYAA